MIQSQVIVKLVEVVKLGGTAPGDALASLVEFGPPALRVLMQDLERSSSTAVQLRLVEALSVFAGQPSFTGHVDLMMVLANMGPRAAEVAERMGDREFEIALAVPSKKFESLRAGLRKVFAGLDTLKEYPD